MTAAPLRVCFVCTGNICRSPTAEVVFAQLVEAAGLTGQITVDSAGTGPWHIGHDMDPRARDTLVRHGYQPARHVAKQFDAADFADRDVVLAIDSGHLARLGQLARATDDPAAAVAAISLLRSYDPISVHLNELDIPDPYYDDNGFDEVLDQVERACAGLLAALTPQLAAGKS